VPWGIAVCTSPSIAHVFLSVAFRAATGDWQLKDDSAHPLLEAAGREKLFATAPTGNALASRKAAGPESKPRA
jgi:hypothetical protein